MALAGPETKCFVCEETYIPIAASGKPFGGCPHCAKTEAEHKENNHFAELDGLDIEERLRRVEKWIYHYKAPRTGPRRY